MVVEWFQSFQQVFSSLYEIPGLQVIDDAQVIHLTESLLIFLRRRTVKRLRTHTRSEIILHSVPDLADNCVSLNAVLSCDLCFVEHV